MTLDDFPPTGTFELTTLGRTTGLPRTVEIWFVTVDGVVYVTGTPGPRGWLANVRADGRVTVTYRGSEHASYATELTDPTERRRFAEAAWRVQPWYAQAGAGIDEWVKRSPMVRLGEPPADAAH